ncbi:MAG: two pore domain potassium channel family protein [Acidobacteria bacterium]|nr:MAG: two pore domain potassium channel family protein [Acidobacteriota bacterium]
MRIFLGIIGCVLALAILLDVFRAVVLARRAQGEFRFTYLFYRLTWPFFVRVGRRIQSGRRREAFLGIYGPLSLLLLFFTWAMGFVLAFTFLQLSAASTVEISRNFPEAFYLSAASFLTIGTGNNQHEFSRWISVAEAGIGYSFLALVIGYLPVFYQSFARRELHISMLDARAGSPPAAAELLSREGKYPSQLERQLAAWEEWAADLLQDELSYPMLAYFRSQHLNQSWIGALVAIADTSALISLSAKDELRHQAEATFAMARHALTDSAKVLKLEPEHNAEDRLSSADFGKLQQIITNCGSLNGGMLKKEEVVSLRALYEPYSFALSSHLLMALPSWIPERSSSDNWRLTSKRTQSTYAVSDPFHDGDKKDRSA